MKGSRWGRAETSFRGGKKNKNLKTRGEGRRKMDEQGVFAAGLK